MKPISQIPVALCQNLKYIFTDIDDTLTLDGKLLPESYAALWKAKDSGIAVVPVSGRPAGWIDHIARMWPVTAAIGENGAFVFFMKNAKLHKQYMLPDAQRVQHRKILDVILKEIKLAIPEAVVSSDQGYREFDLSIDYCEDVPRLSAASIATIVDIFKTHGATVKISSIHINGWFGTTDKSKMIQVYCQHVLRQKPSSILKHALFFGDSPNDAPSFKLFPTSVGVANIQKFLPEMEALPSYICKKEGGEGFAEALKIILKKRGGG